MVVDAAITPVLRELRNCAAEQLALAGRLVCRFPIVFNGGHPPADACDCECPDGDGQAWIRLVTLNSITGAARLGICAGGLFDVTVELGLYRCSPLPQGDEAAVPEQIEEEHALGMLVDAAALRRAVICCGWLHDNDITATIYHQSAIGPSGGCVGIETQVRLQRSDCDCAEHR